MIRLILLSALLCAAIQFTRRVTDTLKIVIEPTSFWIGLMVAVIVAYVFFWLTDWWSAVTRPTRPQSVKHTTDETPSQITRASLKAFVRGVAIITLLGIIIIYLYLSLQKT